MTTFQNTILSDVISEDPLSPASLEFFRTRFKLALHQCVLREFKRQERESGLTKAKLARRIGKKPEVVTRNLAGPGNWTLETVSDLLLGMNAEPDCAVLALAEHRLPAAAKDTDFTKVSSHEPITLDELTRALLEQRPAYGAPQNAPASEDEFPLTSFRGQPVREQDRFGMHGQLANG